jgi:hypothetical protein
MRPSLSPRNRGHEIGDRPRFPVKTPDLVNDSARIKSPNKANQPDKWVVCGVRQWKITAIVGSDEMRYGDEVQIEFGQGRSFANDADGAKVWNTCLSH